MNKPDKDTQLTPRGLKVKNAAVALGTAATIAGVTVAVEMGPGSRGVTYAQERSVIESANGVLIGTVDLAAGTPEYSLPEAPDPQINHSSQVGVLPEPITINNPLIKENPITQGIMVGYNQYGLSAPSTAKERVNQTVWSDLSLGGSQLQGNRVLSFTLEDNGSIMLREHGQIAEPQLSDDIGLIETPTAYDTMAP